MEYKTCPRCGSQFLCQPEHPARCQCAGIVLSDSARSYIAEHYPSCCLCAQCLKQLTKSDSTHMSEFFPIVTPDGQVVGQASRAHCHDGSHLLHPVVHLHVFSPSGELYLQRRAMHKGLLPGYWDTAVGGHVSFGESIEQALTREVAEEIGITDYIPEHVETYRYDSDRESEMVHVFRTTYAGPFFWNDGEVMDGRFWSIYELREAMGKGILTPNLEMELLRFGFI